MPPFLLLPLIGLIWSAFLTVSIQNFMFSAAGALEVVVLVITMTIEVPINTQVNSWKAGSAPPTWIAFAIGCASTGSERQRVQARLPAQLSGLEFIRNRSGGRFQRHALFKKEHQLFTASNGL